MSRRVYAVEGSEDGILHATTSAKRAARIALDYAGDEATLFLGIDRSGDWPTEVTEPASPGRVRRKVLDDGIATVNSKAGRCTATIHRFHDGPGAV